MLRRRSADMGDKVMQFVAYSNVNMARIQASSPVRSAGSQNSMSRSASPNSDPGGVYDAPSLANAIGA